MRIPPRRKAGAGFYGEAHYTGERENGVEARRRINGGGERVRTSPKSAYDARGVSSLKNANMRGREDINYGKGASCTWCYKCCSSPMIRQHSWVRGRASRQASFLNSYETREGKT